MSLNLHTKCKARLVDVLSEQIPNIMVSNRMFMDRRSAIGLFYADEVLPKAGRLKDGIHEYMGELPFFEFAYESLARELSENQEYDSENAKLSISNIEGYEDPRAVATRLVEEFDSLPWEYTFSLPLHKEIAEIIKGNIPSYQISDDLGIYIVDDEFKEKFQLKSGIKGRDKSLSTGGLGLLSLFSENKWDDDSVVIQIKAKGFVGKYGTSPTGKCVEEILKSFCGLGIALRLFKIDLKYRSTPSKAKFYIHKLLDENWVVLSTQELDMSESDAFHDLVVHDLEGKLDSLQKQAGWIARNLPDIAMVFSRENSEKAKKILLGCQWLFESYTSRNELLAFVQTIVVIEILLGDKATSEQIGLGVLLRNRCAYLIGTSQSQRDEILKDFQDIYDVRSKIVHGGKSRMNYEERRLLDKLRWMCRRVIQEEVKLLKDEVGANA